MYAGISPTHALCGSFQNMEEPFNRGCCNTYAPQYVSLRARGCIETQSRMGHFVTALCLPLLTRVTYPR